MLKKDKKMSWGWTIVLIAIGLVCIYPFLFMVSSSFKISGDVLTKPLQLIPDQIIFSNYSDLFGDPYYDFGQWYIKYHCDDGYHHCYQGFRGFHHGLRIFQD